MSEPKKSAKPVSMSKTPASGDSQPPAPRPRTVTLATVALGVSAIAALGAATALFGQTDYLNREQSKANSSAASSASSHAVAAASSSHSDTASAAASAASVNATKYPTSGSRLSDQVSQQQTGGMIMSLVLLVAIGFIAFGVFRGRHWSRWGVLAFWAIASFTGTFAGFTYLLSLGSSLPVAFKVPVFLSALSMLTAVVLCQLRPSVEYFALSKPTHAGTAQRRGLFGPRPPAGARGARPGTPRQKTAITSSAADRGEAYVRKQHAKKRSTANSDAVARGAELARQRAKASKSRRNTES